ncbi:MAG: formylglycine-generating enzyme family protein [Bacteroidales bacterium]|nr:formylglycine-generating enzyme family protein [Bacteroidales bacterium]MCF8455660.1 formylglycine-generating enzyme family protein [Bacteroidales bacterium]
MNFVKRIIIPVLLFSSLFMFPFENIGQNKPPGTVRFKENLYVDKLEICNVYWREYMFMTLKKYGPESEVYLATLPDTLVWDSELKRLYLRHPNYAYHPVVGISYQQAVAYCEWRSKMVNINIYLKETKQKFSLENNYDSIPEVYKYRLPTIEEWEDFSKSPYRKLVERKIRRNNLPRGMFLPPDRIEMSKVKTRPANAGFTNKLGLYNVFGNVAEMTAKKGVAKGGGWQHLEEQCITEAGFSYSEPENWLGFRCVCERVIAEKKEEVPAKPEIMELD